MPAISQQAYLAGFSPLSLTWVVGTDTNVGKTHVTGRLYQESHRKGLAITTQKWVQTGEECDIDEHDRIAGIRGDITLRSYRMPYQFVPPVSPHWAAAMAKTSIDFVVIEHALTQLRLQHHVVIEGSGGVMVPLAMGSLMIDYMVRLGGQVVLVVPNRVGALNHTHLTMEALLNRGVQVEAIILNRGVSVETNEGVLEENHRYCSLVWPSLWVVDWGSWEGHRE